jgi:hypothetical protein
MAEKAFYAVTSATKDDPSGESIRNKVPDSLEVNRATKDDPSGDSIRNKVPDSLEVTRGFQRDV